MIRLPEFVPDKVVRALIRRHLTIGGFLSSAEGTLLFRLANRLPAGAVVVEIGSWKGKSTWCLARGLRSGRLHAIDPFDASGEPGSKEVYAENRAERPLREQFDANLAPLADKITVHQGFSQQFVETFPVIDLLLIDGDHSREGAEFDFTHYAPKLRPGGWVAFHDYYPHRPDFGVTWVIENLVQRDPRFREFARADSLWVAQRV
jgi:predicted O-methyltransferase YrrM